MIGKAVTSKRGDDVTTAELLLGTQPRREAFDAVVAREAQPVRQTRWDDAEQSEWRLCGERERVRDQRVALGIAERRRVWVEDRARQRVGRAEPVEIARENDREEEVGVDVLR